MRYRFWILTWIFCIPTLLSGQILTKELKRHIENARSSHQPIKIAEHFLGLPYKAFALSKENPERLITDLSGFDCVTLFDNLYALYTSKGVDSSYLKQLIKVRYYHPGSVTYENRNHYFSSTVKKLGDVGELNQVQDAAFEVSTPKKLDVLSQFLKMKHYQISLDSILKMEKQFSNQHLTYFPTKSIPKISHLIHEGDLVLFLTNHENMDFHHVGFLVKKGKNWHILHASQQYKKVIVSHESLQEYLRKRPSFPGIQIYHLNLP
ncbi:N-acetylmuramoyl-L-alanine amidase-like domain-containing protein [Aquirufa sp. ROCK-SH2]